MLMKKFRIKRCRKKFVLFSLLLIISFAVFFREMILVFRSVSYSNSINTLLSSYNTFKRSWITKREISDEQLGISDSPKFQQINEHDAWVFSAFNDSVNNKHLVRVLGLQDLVVNNTIFCYLHENGTTYWALGKRTLIPDPHGKRLRFFSYECEIRNISHPSTVSIVFNQSDTPTNSINIFYAPKLLRNFTVCHAILDQFDNYKQLVQSMEFNRILGAEHVFVYRMNVSKETNDVLKYYQNQRFLTVIEWPIPVSEVHYRGQLLAINDCVYRNKGVSRFVAIHDTDEFIIPNHHDNWNDLITEIDKDYYAANKKFARKLGSYRFESTFFYDRPNRSEWEAIKFNNSLTPGKEQLLEKYALTVFTQIKRLNMTFGPSRTKYIVRPELIMLNNIHATYSYRTSVSSINVKVNVSLVHHVRKWYKSKNNLVDTTSWRFMDTLISLVNHTHNELSL